MSKLTCRVVIPPPKEDPPTENLRWYLDASPRGSLDEHDGGEHLASDTFLASICESADEFEQYMRHHGYIGIVVDGHASYHRADCWLTDEHEEAQLVRIEHVLTFGLPPCPACVPRTFGQLTN